MKEFSTYSGAVLNWECDSNGHMNVMYYINKYELAGRVFSLKLGLSKKVLNAHNWGLAVVKQEIEYFQEVFEDEVLTISSSLLSYTNKTFIVHHEMKNMETNVTVGAAKLTMVIIDLEKRKAVSISEELKNQMNLFISE